MPSNIDEPDAYLTTLVTLTKPATHNFLVWFDTDHADCDIDVAPAELRSLFEANNVETDTVQWLNFWSWDSTSNELFKAIATRYKISPRLMGLIWPKPSNSRRTATCDGKLVARAEVTNLIPSSSHSDDLEMAFASQKRDGVIREDASQSQNQDLCFADIANDLWHFCSVDSGAHYLHIGFNQLYVTPGSERHASPDKPSGVRIWTSILLCDDGTVISVSEPPPAEVRNDPKALLRIRGNVINIYKHLSRQHVSSGFSDLLNKVSIRAAPGTTTEPVNGSTAQSTRTEMASLLFYYLFDDWITSYGLIARREHPYRDKLEQIREAMFTSAQVDLIHALHVVGRQLNVLKLMYQSYELIISRILYRQRAFNNPSHRLHMENTFHQHHPMTFESSSVLYPDIDLDHSSIPLPPIHHNNTTITLSASSTTRFERLLDRIRLYALTEIDNCLSEKQELVFMNFNLVALKESHTVEKLTRTTILLAKVTILFLPMSLMTAYFSIQIGNIQQIYSLRTYWVTFAVVTVVTTIGLFAFGVASYKSPGKGGGV